MRYCMKKILLISIFLFCSFQLFAIMPPNPDQCLDCDNTPWINGTLTYSFNYLDAYGNPASCNIQVGYGYRYCNGEVDCFINRLFIPAGSCYTKARHTPGFYENAENELTFHLMSILGDPLPNGTQKFNHWRPGSCSYLCFKFNPESPMVLGTIEPCETSTLYCCIHTIIGSVNSTGTPSTNFTIPFDNSCPGYPDPNAECDEQGDCNIHCN